MTHSDLDSNIDGDRNSKIVPNLSRCWNQWRFKFYTRWNLNRSDSNSNNVWKNGRSDSNSKSRPEFESLPKSAVKQIPNSPGTGVMTTLHFYGHLNSNDRNLQIPNQVKISNRFWIMELKIVETVIWLCFPKIQVDLDFRLNTNFLDSKSPNVLLLWNCNFGMFPREGYSSFTFFTVFGFHKWSEMARFLTQMGLSKICHWQ